MCKRIDHQMEFGQTRQLNADVVKERVVELTANPPGTMLRLMVCMKAIVHSLGTYMEYKILNLVAYVNRNCFSHLYKPLYHLFSYGQVRHLIGLTSICRLYRYWLTTRKTTFYHSQV